RFTFPLDLARAVWVLVPPALLWGASFPLALAAVAKGKDPTRLAAGVYAANTLGSITGALAASLLLVAWGGSQHTQQLLIALSMTAGLLLLLPDSLLSGSASIRLTAAALGVAGALAGGALINAVPPISKLLIAHGRFAATWLGKSDIIYAAEGLNGSV